MTESVTLARVFSAGRRTGAETVAYVRSLPELGTTLLLGGLLWAYGVWLVVPGILVMGYFVRVLRDVPARHGTPDVTPSESGPPRFDGWGSLFVDGVKVYVVWTVYLFLGFTTAMPYAGEETSAQLFVLLLRTLLGNVGFLMRVRSAFGADEFATATFSGGAFADPGVVLFLVSMYVAPAALLNLAARGGLRDGFAFDDIRSILLSRAYAGRWLVFVLLWLASTVVLYLPSTWVATATVPVDLPVLSDAVRESVELLRGIASFALLGLGYVVLGRVAVPPAKRASAGGLAATVYGTRLGSLVGGETRFWRTLLVASFLAVFWSLPAVVLLAGYLVRFVRAVGAGDPPPQFDRLGTLLAEGARAVAVWAAYAAPPLVLLVSWWTRGGIDVRLLTALAGVPGLGLGTWYLGRDLFDLLSLWSPILLHDDLVPVAFAVVALLALYVYPAAVVGLARERRIVAGFDMRSLAVDVARRSYFVAWIRAVVLLAVGAALSLTWNWWRLERPGPDTETLVAIRGVNLVTLPTGSGVVSSLFLLVVSAVGIVLLLRAYAGIARAVSTSREDRSNDWDRT